MALGHRAPPGVFASNQYESHGWRLPQSMPEVRLVIEMRVMTAAMLRRTLSSCGRRVVAILIAYCQLVGTDHLSTTSSSSDLRSSEVKDARIAFRVNDSRSSTPKLRAAANSYSRSMVVHSRTGSSVLRDTGTPASTRSRIGCSSNDGTAPKIAVRRKATLDGDPGVQN